MRQLLLHAHTISFARADTRVWHLVTFCSTLRCTIGVPRLTQRSVICTCFWCSIYTHIMTLIRQSCLHRHCTGGDRGNLG